MNQRINVILSLKSRRILDELHQRTAVNRPALIRLAVHVGLPDVVRTFGPARTSTPTDREHKPSREGGAA